MGPVKAYSGLTYLDRGLPSQRKSSPMVKPVDGALQSNQLALLHEQRYRLQFLRDDGRQRALVILAIALAYAAATRNDFVLLGGRPGLLAISLATRLLLVGVSAAVYVLFHRARWPRQQDRIFYVALAVTAILVSVNHFTRLPVGRVQGPFIGSATLLGVLYFAGRGPIVPRAIFGGVISLGAAAMVLAPNPRAGIDPPIRLTALIAIGALNFVGILSARAFDQQRRQRFEAERRERRTNGELEKRLHELAIEKERAEAMSRARAAFLAAMSHEFRTPMNAVIGLSDIVLDTPLNAENRNHIRAINDSARALLRLLEDILDFAKIDAQKLTLASVPIDLRQISTSVIDMLRPAAAASAVTLTADVAPQVPAKVLGDDARLRQVLVNLVGNAVKFTRHGSVRLQITAPEAESSSAVDSSTITFRIEDTGIGMTPEVMARLFKPFEQGDAGHTRRHGGTGLGLAISKQIVAAMGSDMCVDSKPGCGSVFSFTLHLAMAEAPDAASASVTGAEPSRPALAILVVDDHPLNLEVARAKLCRLGYSPELVESGPEAVAAVSRKDYDVVFMDLHMPEMSGIAATARIIEASANRRAPHIVAMTASVFEEDRAACRRAGMVEFIGKPLDISELDAVLCHLAKERDAVAPVLTREPLENIRRIDSQGQPRLLERMCRVFLSDTPQRLARLGSALERKDAVGIAFDAHTLKAASATLGALGLSELCARLEAAALDGRLEDAGATLQGIAAQFVEVQRALVQEVEGAVPSGGTA